MKKLLSILLLGAAIGVHADDKYGMLYITVPLSKHPVIGVGAMYRYNYGEIRGGFDLNGNTQAGIGFTGNDSDKFVPSVGASITNFGPMPYGAITYGEHWRYGMVTYGGILDTTYLFVGKDNAHDKDSKTSKADTTADVPTGNTGGTPDNNVDDPVIIDEPPVVIGDDTKSNHSGQHDGSNPGNGSEHHDNGGMNNPGHD